MRRRLTAAHGSADVEDVVQDTLLVVHLKRATWDQALPFTPWLNAVARHKAIDVIRRKGDRVDVEIVNSADEIFDAQGDADLTLDVEIALAALDARRRTIVEQVSLERRSASDVGDALGLTEGATQIALHRALKAMPKTLNGSAP